MARITIEALVTGHYNYLPPKDRVLPDTAPSGPNFKEDLEEIKKLQMRFDQEVTNEGTRRNYNPVLAWWRTQRSNTKAGTESEKHQVITSLAERYHTAQSIVRYTIDESLKIRDERLPIEPAEVTYQRGVFYSEDIGPDFEREKSELQGFLKVQEKLTNPNTTVHSKMVVVSGPSFVKDTIFTKNFVDVYELIEEDGKRIVKMTRFASNASYDQYKERAAHLKPDYFNEARGPVDSWFLSNPIYIDPRINRDSAEDIFRKISGERKDVIEKGHFQVVIKEVIPLIDYYLQAICAPFFDPVKIASRFHAVVAQADFELKELRKVAKGIVGKIQNFIKDVPVFRNIAEKADWFSHQVIEKVMGGCGMSGGFSIGKSITSFISSVLENVSNVFSGKDQYGSLEFKCPKCKQTNRRPKGQLIPNCQHCNANVCC